ncbi:hypothetical protein YC2023_096040 [Brassica napus]
MMGLIRGCLILWEGRIKVEVLMRLQALRVVREGKRDRVVVFVDDGNMHSMK